MDNKTNLNAVPADVPVYNCIVYVSSSDDGYRARVANLADLECRGGSEREVLSKLVPAFKQRVEALSREGVDIPWIEPPSPIADGEQERLIPVHL